MISEVIDGHLSHNNRVRPREKNFESLAMIVGASGLKYVAKANVLARAVKYQVTKRFAAEYSKGLTRDG